MTNKLYALLEKKMQQSFSKRWDPELDIHWGLEPQEQSENDNVLAGNLYITAVDNNGNEQRIYEFEGKATTREELEGWVAELLSIALEKHPVWRISKVRKH